MIATVDSPTRSAGNTLAVTGVPMVMVMVTGMVAIVGIIGCSMRGKLSRRFG